MSISSVLMNYTNKVFKVISNRMVTRGYITITRSLLAITSKPTIPTQCTRSASTFIRFRSWYRSLFAPKALKPPFNHVCQVGDPVLRQAAQRVSPDQIASQEIQKIIATLRKVMKEYQVASLSAPQIGLPLQIFVMELNKETLETVNEHVRDVIKISVIPYTVVINPAVKVLDYTQETNIEVCPSILGFSADVNRYSSLKITAWNEKAERREWEASGFEARVIQHEMDHLAGLLFTDRMDSRTLTCAAWQAVNAHKGQVFIPYWPKKRRRGLFGNVAG